MSFFGIHSQYTFVRLSRDANSDAAPARFTIGRREGRVSVGRGGSIVMDSSTDPGCISRVHCFLEVDTLGALHIQDRSLNGVYVNGDRLARGITTVIRGSQRIITFGPDDKELTYRVICTNTTTGDGGGTPTTGGCFSTAVSASPRTRGGFSTATNTARARASSACAGVLTASPPDGGTLSPLLTGSTASSLARRRVTGAIAGGSPVTAPVPLPSNKMTAEAGTGTRGQLQGTRSVSAQTKAFGDNGGTTTTEEETSSSSTAGTDSNLLLTGGDLLPTQQQHQHQQQHRSQPHERGGTAASKKRDPNNRLLSPSRDEGGGEEVGQEVHRDPHHCIDSSTGSGAGVVGGGHPPTSGKGPTGTSIPSPTLPDTPGKYLPPALRRVHERNKQRRHALETRKQQNLDEARKQKGDLSTGGFIRKSGSLLHGVQGQRRRPPLVAGTCGQKDTKERRQKKEDRKPATAGTRTRARAATMQSDSTAPTSTDTGDPSTWYSVSSLSLHGEAPAGSLRSLDLAGTSLNSATTNEQQQQPAGSGGSSRTPSPLPIAPPPPLRPGTGPRVPTPATATAGGALGNGAVDRQPLQQRNRNFVTPLNQVMVTNAGGGALTGTTPDSSVPSTTAGTHAQANSGSSINPSGITPPSTDGEVGEGEGHDRPSFVPFRVSASNRGGDAGLVFTPHAAAAGRSGRPSTGSNGGRPSTDLPHLQQHKAPHNFTISRNILMVSEKRNGELKTNTLKLDQHHRKNKKAVAASLPFAIGRYGGDGRVGGEMAGQMNDEAMITMRGGSMLLRSAAGAGDHQHPPAATPPNQRSGADTQRPPPPGIASSQDQRWITDSCPSRVRKPDTPMFSSEVSEFFDVKNRVAKSSMEGLLKGFDVESDTFCHSSDFIAHLKFGLPLLANRLQPLLGAESLKATVPSPAFVFGDLHGSFSDLEMIYRHCVPFGGLKYMTHHVVFLGDFVDRGPHSVEVVIFLFAWKLLCPAKIHLIRGNHEDPRVNGDLESYGDGAFLAKCSHLFGPQEGKLIWETTNEAFQHLPVAAVIAQSIFACHGGIPCITAGAGESMEAFATLLERNEFPRFAEVAPCPYDDPVTAVQRRVVRELLWNDPISSAEENEFSSSGGHLNNSGFRPSEIRAGGDESAGVYEFTASALENFLDMCGYRLMLRAHQHKGQGIQLAHCGRVITVFTSSNYCTLDNAAGGCLVDGDGKVRLLSWRRDFSSSEQLGAISASWHDGRVPTGVPSAAQQGSSSESGTATGGSSSIDGSLSLRRVLAFANLENLPPPSATRPSHPPAPAAPLRHQLPFGRRSDERRGVEYPRGRSREPIDSS